MGVSVIASHHDFEADAVSGSHGAAGENVRRQADIIKRLAVMRRIMNVLNLLDATAR